MNKKVLFILVIVGMMMLCSCSFTRGGATTMINVDEESKANARMEAILAAIENKDQVALKDMFSNKALSDVDDFESTADNLFEFVGGKVLSSNLDKWGSESPSEYGRKTVQIFSWYTVTTNKGEYEFFLLDYNTDTIEPDNEGMYTLHVKKAGVDEPQFKYWQDMAEIPGVYVSSITKE